MQSMDNGWEEAATTTHQDHVIAHVVDTTVLGYLVLRDAIHLLLDIGFIWKIYVDGEMGLLPHPVAVAELELDEGLLAELKLDVDWLLKGNGEAQPLRSFVPLTARFPIKEVQLFIRGAERKLLLEGETETVEIMTSTQDDSIQVTEG
jgi:hypothetical protein